MERLSVKKQELIKSKAMKNDLTYISYSSARVSLFIYFEK